MLGLQLKHGCMAECRGFIDVFDQAFLNPTAAQQVHLMRAEQFGIRQAGLFTNILSRGGRRDAKCARNDDQR